MTKQGDSKGEVAKNPLKASNGDSVFHEIGHEIGGDGDWMPVEVWEEVSSKKDLTKEVEETAGNKEAGQKAECFWKPS